MSGLFDKHGGFRRLHSFTLAAIVQIETLRFCRRFLTFAYREAGSKFYDPKAVNAVSLDEAAFSDDLVHESAKYALEQRKKYAQWLDTDDVVVFANAMLIIIGRALNMLKSQIKSQGKAFEETGGFNERLMAKRIESREKSREPSPECPQCGKPMRRRKSAKGEFWGCSDFPDCKGTWPM